jgi:hypothetical protein
MKKPLNEEFKRMQQLAGLITENVISNEGKANFGPFKNVEWYKVGNEGTISLIVTNSDNFMDIEKSMDFEGRDYLKDKEINFLNNKVEEIADDMSEYLTSIGVVNEIFDNPLGYGQEIDNLVVSINLNDLSKLK